MDLCEHPNHGTSGLIKLLSLLGFEQIDDEPCVYNKQQDRVVTFLVLYVDDILLIGNDTGELSA